MDDEALPGAIEATTTLPDPTAGQGAVAAPGAIGAVTSLPEPILETATADVSSLGLDFVIDVTSALSNPWKGYATYDSSGQPPEYKVLVLEPGGETVLGYVRDASVGPISWILDGMGSVSITVPVMSDDIGLMEVAEREVQIWRGSDMIWWGVVIRARGDEKTVAFQCRELGWYFTKRYIGAGETNYVKNGDFEGGLGGWNNPHFAPEEPQANRGSSNYTIELSNFAISGSQSVHIVCNDVPIWGAGIAQFVAWEVDPATNPEGDTWYLVAWLYIPSSEWVGPRIAAYTNDGVTTGAMGVHFQRASLVDLVYTGGMLAPGPIEQIMIQIDEETPKDRWIRLQVELEQPVTGDPEAIGIQLFGPVGGIYYDSVSLVREEALSFHGQDQATILQGLVEHAQSATYGKSDLKIPASCPATGIKRTRVYYFYNNELISDTIDEWPGLWQGMDWSISTTPTSRTFVSHYPQRGSYKIKAPLVFGKNISRVKMDRDGEATANQVLVFADQGDGSAREEVQHTEAAALTNNLTLELRYAATPGSAVSTLAAQAERGVRRFKNPVELPTITVYQQEDDELLGVLEPGDIVNVNVQHGWYQLNGDYRIMEIVLDPNTEEMDLVINPYANWDIV